MNGLYGTVRPANIDVNRDVEIFYRYRPTRSTSEKDYMSFKPISSSMLEQSTMEDNGKTSNLLGLYNLKLPFDIFNKKGFYTIYIRPKEYLCEVYDTGVLSVDKSIKGVVFANDKVPETDLTGYRIEYLDSLGNKSETVRLITSCNYCEPVATSISESFAKANSYRLLSNTATNMLFCTVTPSTSPSFKANTLPFIGKSGDNVYIINTKFNPIMLEVELVEHDYDTISYMLEGDQVRDRDKGIITTYDDNKEIYQQYDYYTLKDSLGKPLYDVKVNRPDIDGTQSYDNVITTD